MPNQFSCIDNLSIKPRQEPIVKDLWENSKLSARQIGQQFNCTKNVIIGLVDRRNWNPRKPVKTRFNQRINALHENLDQVLNSL